MPRASSFIHTSEIKNLLNWFLIMLLVKKINGILLCEDIDHANAIFRTGSRTTHVVRAGDLVPTGTMLVTPGLQSTQNNSGMCKQKGNDDDIATWGFQTYSKESPPFKSSARQNLSTHLKNLKIVLKRCNSPLHWARELFKLSTDSAHLLVLIKKTFDLGGRFYWWRHKEGMFLNFWPTLTGPGC